MNSSDSMDFPFALWRRPVSEGKQSSQEHLKRTLELRVRCQSRTSSEIEEFNQDFCDASPDDSGFSPLSTATSWCSGSSSIGSSFPTSVEPRITSQDECGSSGTSGSWRKVGKNPSESVSMDDLFATTDQDMRMLDSTLPRQKTGRGGETGRNTGTTSTLVTDASMSENVRLAETEEKATEADVIATFKGLMKEQDRNPTEKAFMKRIIGVLSNDGIVKKPRIELEPLNSGNESNATKTQVSPSAQRRRSQLKLKCSYCSLVCYGVNSYRGHQVAHDTKNQELLSDDFMKSYQCYFDVCCMKDKTFSFAELLVHIRDGHLSVCQGPTANEEYFKCPCCQEPNRFADASSLRVAAHVMITLGKTSCGYCGKFHITKLARKKCQLLAESA